MNKLIVLGCIGLWLLIGSLQAQDTPTFQNRQDSISYALGVDIGRNIQRADVPINADALIQGIKDMTQAGGSQLTDEQARALLMAFQQEAQQRQIAKQREQGQKAKSKGDAFLAENLKKDGVKATESGLQYLVLQAGSGDRPTLSSTVKVHYEGKLLDGTVFDSSYQRGEPIEFPLGNVIQGWQEGLQLMQKGAKYQFFIPYNLAYGERGSPPKIGPNETLIFQIELLEFK